MYLFCRRATSLSISTIQHDHALLAPHHLRPKEPKKQVQYDKNTHTYLASRSSLRYFFRVSLFLILLYSDSAAGKSLCGPDTKCGRHAILSVLLCNQLQSLLNRDRET